MQTTANVLFSIPPRVVIDTNALLVSISSRSASHILFSALQAGKYVICCSNDIIEEYAEIIAKLWDNTVSSSVINTLLMLANLERIEVYYHWQLITHDRDDDKFVDCAIAARADCIVTNDNHYKVLAEVDFPTLPTITLEDFCAYLSGL